MLERLVSSQNMATVRIDNDLPTCVDLLPRQAKVRRRVLQAVEKIVGDQRDVLVHFRPQELAASLEMDQPAVAHALYELSESDWFTYVPPFRGRAIRMLKRDVPFEELEIDFAALEKRKAAEYDKLNRMVRFALSGACRQQEILHYFGEGQAGPCNHCDNCSRHEPKSRRRPGVPGARAELQQGGSSGLGRQAEDRSRRTNSWLKKGSRKACARPCGWSSAASPAASRGSPAARTSSPRCSADPIRRRSRSCA